jgi:hypothetical protein
VKKKQKKHALSKWRTNNQPSRAGAVGCVFGSCAFNGIISINPSTHPSCQQCKRTETPYDVNDERRL